MPSELGLRFNRSPTFSNFQVLAQRSGAEAKAVLKRIAQGLAMSNVSVDNRSHLNALLEASEAQLATLAANSALLQSIFPSQATAPETFAAWVAEAGKVQSLAWTAHEPPPQVSISGKVTQPDGKTLLLTTPSGRRFSLASSRRNPGDLPVGWLKGFVNPGEGELTVQGTLSADGTAFMIEGYAPGTNPDFIFGRVKVSLPFGAITTKPTPDQLAEIMGGGGRVSITTARGEVEITHPELKKALALMPQLGIILPGSIQKNAEGRWTTDAKGDFLYALGGRFTGVSKRGNGEVEVHASFAVDNFTGPVRARGETAKHRMEQSGLNRNWVGGKFVFDDPPPHFAATYVSGALKSPLASYLALPDEAAANQQLLASAEMIDPAELFARTMGAPGGAAKT